jgi:hypothetical protein
LTFFHAPSIVFKNPQTPNDNPLVRPQRLFKEVYPLQTTSKEYTYLPVQALKICLELGGLEFKHAL